MFSSATLADNVNTLFIHLFINLVNPIKKYLLNSSMGQASCQHWNTKLNKSRGLYLLEIPNKTKCKANKTKILNK